MTVPAAPLLDIAHAAVATAAEVYRGHPAARCAALARRLDGPLRLAIAGKVKAGKSTLINALVGDRVAAVDAAECTRVVTWYEAADHPRVTLQPRAGPAVALPVQYRAGKLAVDLGDRPPSDVEQLVVGWPAPDLRRFTLVDTPGVASLSADVGARTVRLLDPDEDGLSGTADAVIYLLRHLHAADLDLLQSLRGLPRMGSVTAIALLSRADEIAGARIDAMESAAEVAARYRSDPTVRGLCLDVVAVAGLLAETGRTLTTVEFDTVAALATLPPSTTEEALRSADHFGAVPTGGLDADQRSWLLQRLGVFGLRLAVGLVRNGAGGAAQLGPELVRRSGLAELRSSLATRVEARRDVLVARSVLMELRRLVRAEPSAGTTAIAAEIDRTLLGAPELVELRTLTALRSQAMDLPAELVAEGLAVLGDVGLGTTARLSLPSGSDERECRTRTSEVIRRWRERAESPVTDHATAVVCRTVVRAGEAIAAELDARRPT